MTPCLACGKGVMEPTALLWLRAGDSASPWRECRACGLIQPGIQPTAALVRTWYGTEPFAVSTAAQGIPARWKTWALQRLTRAVLRRDWRRWPSLLLLHPLLGHFQGLPSLAPIGRALDVGCGDGEWLAILQSCGWTGVGIEMDPRRAAATRTRGVSVWPGDVSAYPGAAASFDVVRFWHVLEHMPDPSAALRDARRWLKPGGELILGVPNVQSAAHRVFRRTWSGLQYPKHLHHFTARAIDQLVRSAGFLQVRVRHRSCGTWLDSAAVAGGRVGAWLTRQPPIRLLSIYADGALDSWHVGDGFDVRAMAPDPP